nr:unnamed protein product [Haemonchus contortus]
MMPKDSRYAYMRPRQICQNLAEEVDHSEGAGAAEREDMLHYFCRNGYDSRRHAIRSTVLLKHTYYSDAIIEKACRIGLYGLVEDGVHDLQPDATNANGQLYTIHGFIASSVDVPLLFAVATRKNERVYERIFGKLKEATEAAGGRNNIRILLDYKKAAINAAKRCFPSASIEGDIWCKWDVSILRTTYAAESFNRLLGVLMQVKHPRMSDLLRALPGTVTTARGTLLNIKKRRMDPRPLRRRDILRRRRFEREMARFKEHLSRTRAFRTTRTIRCTAGHGTLCYRESGLKVVQERGQKHFWWVPELDLAHKGRGLCKKILLGPKAL